MQLKALPVAVLAVTVSALAASADPIDPAQAIAQKFYEASQPKISVKSVSKPVVQPVASPAAKPVVQPISNTSASDPEPVTRSPPPGLDYEMDMLRQARAEEQEFEKRNSQDGLTNVEQPSPAQTPPRVSEAPATPPLETTPTEQATPQPAATEATAPEHAAPEPAAPEPAPPQSPEAAKPESRQPSPPLQTAIKQEQERAAPSTDATATGTRATVLIVLDTDDDAAAPKPDPIICFDQQCWISNGLEAPAKPMPRSVAMALKTTENVTHDSCSGKIGCAFRDIAFQPNAQIQVVEVGESRGVSDGAFTVASDSTCRKNDGDLVCDNALVTQAFRMWVVPETTAQASGPSALEDAIANNLPGNDDAGPDDGK
jgi:hypothetical protein